MKDGDRIYCKKSLKYDTGIFKQNSYYDIESIRRSSNPINNYDYIYTGAFGMVKVLMENFGNHFCTEKELRKLKLEKIENG